MLAAYTLWLLFWQNDLLYLIDSFTWSSYKLAILCAIICMTPLNWGLEAIKWKTAMQPFTIDLRNSLRSVLSGVTIGLITPARLGEYAGRMLYIPNDQRVWSGLATLRCSLAQSTITFSAGILSLLWISTNQEFSFLGIDPKLILVLSVVLLVLTIFIYLRIDLVLPWINRIVELFRNRLGMTIQTHTDRISVSIYHQMQILSYAVIRYLVYLSQYALMLLVFGFDQSLLSIAAGISLVFLVQSLVPVPAVAKVFARTGAAAAIFSLLGYENLEVILASLLLWVINLLLPALCGLVLLLRKERELN